MERRAVARRRTSRSLAGAVATALLVAACTPGDAEPDDDPSTLFPSSTEESSEAEPSPTPNTSEEPSPEESTESAAPSPSEAASDDFAVPDEISPEYVERVLNEINRLDAEIAKTVLELPVDESAAALPSGVRQSLTDIYGEPLLSLQIGQNLELLRSSEEREDLLDPDEIGQLRTSVEEVLASQPCLVARGRTDLTEVDAEVKESDPVLSFYYLIESPEDSNTAGWRLIQQLDAQVGDERLPEEEARSYTAEDLSEQAPPECR